MAPFTPKLYTTIASIATSTSTVATQSPSETYLGSFQTSINQPGSFSSDIETITFGILATLIAFASLGVAYLQFRNSMKQPEEVTQPASAAGEAGISLGSVGGGTEEESHEGSDLEAHSE